MNGLILHPTDMCQWHALVNEAQAATCLVLNETTESYLVFLLMRYAKIDHLFESVMAIDYLESMQQIGSQRVERLREVGDKSLLFCGLFPGLAQRRRVSLDYFSSLGRAAYLTVGELESHAVASLYFELSEKFPTLQKILQAMRGEFKP